MLAMGDIAIAPKLSLTEGSGKILNYMAMALPTVAFSTTAQTELLGHLGVYAPIGDVEQLAARIAELMDQPERRRALGQNARLRAIQQYGWDRVGNVMETAYRNLTTDRQPYPLMMRADSATLR